MRAGPDDTTDAVAVSTKNPGNIGKGTGPGKARACLEPAEGGGTATGGNERMERDLGSGDWAPRLSHSATNQRSADVTRGDEDAAGE